MKKYEYIFMTNSGSIGKIREEFKSLGVDGWEYCGIEYICKEQNIKEYIFKRELPQDWAKESLEKVEEITEDQREEEVKVCPPHEYESLGTEDGEKECVFCGNTPLDSFKQEHIGGGDKKLDHQSLREESLKEIIKIIRVTPEPIEREDIEVWMRIPKKYAEAWRDLLDKKEG